MAIRLNILEGPTQDRNSRASPGFASLQPLRQELLLGPDFHKLQATCRKCSAAAFALCSRDLELSQHRVKQVIRFEDCTLGMPLTAAIPACGP